MRVLVACEESQTVMKAFLALGHDAWSCDLQECSGGMPERHHRGDVFEFIANSEPFDMMIAHPVCTRLTNAGVRWLFDENGNDIPLKWVEMHEGREFFMRFLGDETAHIPKIVVENPIPHRHANLPPYTQCIQPWMFGDNYSKATCLWIRGLPPLVPQVLTEPEGVIHACHNEPPGPDRAKNRSKTYPGIAQAMATQWGTDWQPTLELGK